MKPDVLRVAIGSIRPPKVEAVRSVLGRVVHFMGYSPDHVSYIARGKESGVSRMPLSVHEIRRGARNRAEEARRLIEAEFGYVDFAIGLEGGFFIMGAEDTEHVQLQSWAYVEYNHEAHYGSSMSMPVPKSISHAVIEQQQELGKVLDHFAGRKGLRNKEGAFGFFSLGFLTRQQAFELALLGALAPFYHNKLYHSP